MKSTGYEGYSQIQLHSMFSTENWSRLSLEDKINACQEVENRYATENNVQPCNVTHEPMNGASYGWQSGNTICLNTSLVRDGVFITTYTDSNGQRCLVETPALAPSWNTLDTLYHEGTHGIQKETGRMPSTYISPSMDGDLYRIQGIEKEAYAMGQSKTLDALSEVEQSSGKYDASRNDYFATVRNDSFQAALQDAAQHYNDPNIESTLQSVISDRENGVSPEKPSFSYQAISNLCDNYETHASIDMSNSSINTIGNDITSDSQIRQENNAAVEDTQESFSYLDSDLSSISSDVDISQAFTLISEGNEMDDGVNSFSYTDGIDSIQSTEMDDGINYESSSPDSTYSGSQIDDGVNISTDIDSSNDSISNDLSGMSFD